MGNGKQIRLKALFLVSIIISSLAIFYLSIFFYQQKGFLREFTEDKRTDTLSILSIMVTGLQEQYANRLKSFADSKKEIMKAFADGDREKLFSLVYPYYEILKKEKESFHLFFFITDDNIAFLRVQKKDVYGDKVADLNPLIYESNRLRKPLAGFEIVKKGLKYLITHPVYVDETYVGLIGFGIDMSYFVKGVKEHITNEVGIIFSEEKFSKAVFIDQEYIRSRDKIILPYESRFFQSLPYEKIQEKKQLIKNFSDRQYVTITDFNLNSYDHKPVARLALAVDVTEKTLLFKKKLFAASIITLALAAGIFFVVSYNLGIMIKQITALNNSLEQKVRERTHDLELEINERKRAEDKALKSEKRFRELFESISDLIFTQDMEGRFLSTNPAMQKLFGYTEEEFQDQKATGFMKSDMASYFRTHYLEAIKKQGFHEGVTGYVKKDGSKIYIDYRISKVISPDGIPYISGMGKDVTEKIKSDRKMKQLEAQIVQSQKMEAIGTLAGGIAHDFNNILFSLLGFLDLAMEDITEDSPAYSKMVKVLIAAHMAKKIVGQILTFSMKTKTEKKPIYIQSIIENVVNLLKTSIPPTIAVKYDMDNSCGPVLADTTQIQQILINLITNATHAMQKTGGVLEISLTEKRIGFESRNLDLDPGDYVQLSVSDAGHGIRQEILDRIFDPYFTTKNMEKGTGMGLAVVHGIINEHKGAISVNSQVGQGTVFHIFLPKVDPPSLLLDEQKEKTVETVLTGTEHILLVDDDKLIVSMMKETLTQLGYSVTSYNNGIEALEAFKARPGDFDLVFSDIVMLDMTGVDLFRSLKAVRSEIPVVACTGNNEILDKEKAGRMGFSAYLLKPVDKSEIAEAIRNSLDESKTIDPI